MNRSESIINNFLIEVDALSYRITNINQSFLNTSHVGLRERLFYENISFSNLLVEKCERTIIQTKMEKKLFFL